MLNINEEARKAAIVERAADEILKQPDEAMALTPALQDVLAPGDTGLDGMGGRVTQPFEPGGSYNPISGDWSGGGGGWEYDGRVF